MSDLSLGAMHRTQERYAVRQEALRKALQAPTYVDWLRLVRDAENPIG